METAHWMSLSRSSDSATSGGFWKYASLYIFKPSRGNVIKSSASNQFTVFISRSVRWLLELTGLKQNTKAVETAISYVPNDFPHLEHDYC